MSDYEIVLENEKSSKTIEKTIKVKSDLKKTFK